MRRLSSVLCCTFHCRSPHVDHQLAWITDRSGHKGVACGNRSSRPANVKCFQSVGDWLGRRLPAGADPHLPFLLDAAGGVRYISPMAAHNHDHEEGSNLSEMELRVRALETILVEKGYVETAALDRIIELYETKIGPHIGAQVIAKAWTDPSFRESLLQDASKAVSALAEVGRVGDHLIAVENTPQVHNMVVCTLCSCYPTDVLGLPPTWYKSFAYRSRVVKEPRAVLADFGVTLPVETEIRVWDSTAETRLLVMHL